MYKKGIYEITENLSLTHDIYRMKLRGDTQYITAPGQFINISVEGFYLRRPISICDYEGDTITIIYKVVGGGTEKMSRMLPGEKLDVLTGLGNGFSTAASGDAPMLVGGGVGVPPLYKLARELIGEGKRVSVVLGFNTAKDIFYVDEFKALGADVTIATASGEVGVRGFVTDAMNTLPSPSYIYTCGPIPMLRAIYDASSCSGEYSFEERMGCGFGACMGCSCKTKYGNKRICKDGPILKKEEIIW